MKVENCAKRTKQGRLQHRLQLGILLPCEARRTADQVPKMGIWSHRQKDRKKGKNFCLTTQRFFEL
jgi:hypothetical protein